MNFYSLLFDEKIGVALFSCDGWRELHNLPRGEGHGGGATTVRPEYHTACLVRWAAQRHDDCPLCFRCYVHLDAPPPRDRAAQRLAAMDGILLIATLLSLLHRLYRQGLGQTPAAFLAQGEAGWTTVPSRLSELFLGTDLASLSALLWYAFSVHFLLTFTLVMWRNLLVVVLLARLVTTPLVLLASLLT